MMRLSDGPAVALQGVSKRYEIYPRPFDRLRQALSGGRRRYCTEVDALRDVSFSVARGTTMGILGRNGSGKSTLLQIIAGALKPSSGRVETAGTPSALLELGSGFHPDFSGRENVFIYGMLRGAARAEVERRFAAIEAFADIGEFMDRPISTYSTGMMMRLAFSAAVHLPADLLVIDEVLAVGDAFFQSKCVAKIKELHSRGATMIIVSHDMSLVRSLCSEAIVLDGGRLSYRGSASTAAEHYYQVCARANGAHELPAQSSAGVEDGPPILWNTLRYGSGKARLRRCAINGDSSPRIVQVESGAELRIELEYQFSEHVEQPIAGVMIKTPTGIEVYGTNTHYRDITMGRARAGDEISVTFQVEARLNNGPYLLTLTICELSHAGEIVYMDRFVDACLIQITGGPTRHAGFCNLVERIEVGARA